MILKMYQNRWQVATGKSQEWKCHGKPEKLSGRQYPLIRPRSRFFGLDNVLKTPRLYQFDLSRPLIQAQRLLSTQQRTIVRISLVQLQNYPRTDATFTHSLVISFIISPFTVENANIEYASWKIASFMEHFTVESGVEMFRKSRNNAHEIDTGPYFLLCLLKTFSSQFLFLLASFHLVLVRKSQLFSGQVLISTNFSGKGAVSCENIGVLFGMFINVVGKHIIIYFTAEKNIKKLFYKH